MTTELGGDASAVDGRTARRDRNRLAVLDAVIELFQAGVLQPDPEDVAARSGVSLRSVYRYYSDRDELRRAAMERHLEGVRHLFELPEVGVGSLEDRVGRFVDARLRLHDAIAPSARAARLAAAGNEAIRHRYEQAQRQLRGQIDRHFAAELDAMAPERADAIAAAVDALVQVEALDRYLLSRRLSAAQTAEQLRTALLALLHPSAPQ
jgi:AcrR family transcriptional regulator